MTDSEGELAARLDGMRLTTAQILYHMPDHPHVLQSFTWQTLDLPPRFPRMQRFLDHWHREIEAVIHSVSIAADNGVQPSRWRRVDAVLRIQ
jgi:uncharacterized protein Usg